MSYITSGGGGAPSYAAKMSYAGSTNSTDGNADGVYNPLVDANTVGGNLDSWTYTPGGVRATAAPHTADAGGGSITVKTNGAHGLSVGDPVILDNMAGMEYEGLIRVITVVPSSTTFTIPNAYATSFGSPPSSGNVRWPDQLKAGAAAASTYLVAGAVSAEAAAAATVSVVLNDTIITTSTSGAGTGTQGFPFADLVDIVANDILWMVTTATLTQKDLSLTLTAHS